MQPWGEPEAGCLRSSRTYSNIRLSKSPRIDTVSSIEQFNTRHVKTLKILISMGADPKTLNKQGQNPLHIAETAKQQDAVNYLKQFK